MDFTITCQCNLRLLVFLSVTYGRIKFFKYLTASLKQGHTGGGKLRRDGTFFIDAQSCVGRGVDVLPLGHIIPALELIARRRGRRYLIGGHGALGVGVGLGDTFPVHGIGTVLGGLEGHVGFFIGHQLHVGQRDLGGGVGGAGLDVDLDAGVGRQLLGKLVARRDRLSAHLNGAAVLCNGIVKGQRCFCGSLVGDGQRRVKVCIATSSRLTLCVTGNSDTAGGGPRILRIAGEAQSNVLVGQTGHGAARRRPRRGSHGGQHGQYHEKYQRQRKKSLEYLFHPLFFPPCLFLFSISVP